MAALTGLQVKVVWLTMQNIKLKYLLKVLLEPFREEWENIYACTSGAAAQKMLCSNKRLPHGEYLATVAVKRGVQSGVLICSCVYPFLQVSNQLSGWILCLWGY